MGKQVKTILIVAISCFLAGFFLKDVILPKDTIVHNMPVYIPSISKQTDTVEVEKVTELILPGKDSIVVDSTYYHKYLAEKDKSKQLEIFVDAIKVRDTTLTLEDNDTIKIDVWTKTRGALLAQSVNYNIKERTINVPIELPRPPRYELYGGLFTDVPTMPGGRFSVGASLGLNVDDKTYWNLGYDTRGTVSIGVSKSIFNF